MGTALLDVGPARLFIYNPGELAIGNVKGGIKVRGKLNIVNLTHDEIGTTKGKKVITGRECQLMTALADYSIQSVRYAFAGTALQDDVTATKKGVALRPDAGKIVPSYKFVIKPIDPTTGDVSADANTYIWIPSGSITEDTVEIVWAPEEQRLLPFSLDCLPAVIGAQTKECLMFFGDTAIADANESGF